MSSAMESVFILFDANLQSYPPLKKKKKIWAQVSSKQEGNLSYQLTNALRTLVKIYSIITFSKCTFS